MDPNRLEEIALNAWPALQQILYDGWIVRFSRGFTRRANSVNAVYPSTFDPEAKIAACEALYAARGLPPIFRVTPFSLPPELDALLEARGYGRHDPTLVMVCELGGLEAGRPLVALPAAAWLDHFCRLAAVPREKHCIHQAILDAIVPDHVTACVTTGEKVVACGLAVAEGGYVGLFDLITDPACRRRGHGTHLVQGLIAWGRARGASRAYLQVMHKNKGARRLYERLGFREVYRYWYRMG
ncbi:MAG: GNAT family N-acetyltransferase [Anaerolineae bacterium]|jgi:ribosomal protein S18 acetylase RimI-like enzyme